MPNMFPCMSGRGGSQVGGKGNAGKWGGRGTRLIVVLGFTAFIRIWEIVVGKGRVTRKKGRIWPAHMSGQVCEAQQCLIPLQ